MKYRIEKLDCDSLIQCGEFFAAGFFSHPESPTVVRMARALACHLAHMEPPPWNGTRLYPGNSGVGEPSSHLYSGRGAVSFHYTTPMHWDWEALEQKIAKADGRHKQALLGLQTAMQEYPYFMELGGWIHASVNFRRILSEGLNSYAARIESLQAEARESQQPGKIAFYDAMQITMDGIRAFHARVLEMLKACDTTHDEGKNRRIALIDALKRVPFEPATDFYEAMVAENLVFYLDGCDGLGRFDQDLSPFYKADTEAGRITQPEALALIEELWASMECTAGWNVAIGGAAPDGTSGINELTYLCLEAARNRGGARPNLALRLPGDAPGELWQEAFRTLETGIGQPALYCEENYFQSIRDVDLGVSEEDLPDFAFGGCTELIVHGKSCCGGADTHLNLCLVLDKCIRTHLAGCETFDAFFDTFVGDIRNAAATAADHTNRCYEQMALWQPQPIRSLLIDDCIDRGVEYHAGGARYNWSVVSIGGIANAADSLQALREVVFEQKEITASEMVQVLKDDFRGREDVRTRLARCAKYGNDDAGVDDLAAKVAEIAFRAFLSERAGRDGRFAPGCILLDWYGAWGRDVGALPDGRKAGEPIADSVGPYQGRDRSGPTAMLSSVAKIPQHLAPGTLVLNARFSRELFREPSSRDKLRDLVRAYFKKGGMQIQINVVDQETLMRAMEDPGSYAGLIVRVGGYSAYWHTLSESVRSAVVARAEHG